MENFNAGELNDNPLSFMKGAIAVRYIYEPELAKLTSERDELREKLEASCKACKELVIIGSDGCATCEAGRVTLYTQGRYCLSCLAKIRGDLPTPPVEEK